MAAGGDERPGRRGRVTKRPHDKRRNKHERLAAETGRPRWSRRSSPAGSRYVAHLYDMAGYTHTCTVLYTWERRAYSIDDPSLRKKDAYKLPWRWEASDVSRVRLAGGPGPWCGTCLMVKMLVRVQIRYIFLPRTSRPHAMAERSQSNARTKSTTPPVSPFRVLARPHPPPPPPPVSLRRCPLRSVKAPSGAKEWDRGCARARARVCVFACARDMGFADVWSGHARSIRAGVLERWITGLKCRVHTPIRTYTHTFYYAHGNE